MQHRNPLDVAIELPLFDDPRRRYENSDTATGERELWLRVLELAATDALGETGIYTTGDATREARAWWRRPARRMVEIVTLLGLDVGWCRRMMVERIRRVERTEDRKWADARKARDEAKHAEWRDAYRARMERMFPGYLDRRRASGYHVD